jgi:hypothetical protein
MAMSHINGLTHEDIDLALQEHPVKVTNDYIHDGVNGHIHYSNGLAVEPSAARVGNETEYKIRESPMGTKRQMKVIFMGMGCSGINSNGRRRMWNLLCTRRMLMLEALGLRTDILGVHATYLVFVINTAGSENLTGHITTLGRKRYATTSETWVAVMIC